MQPFKLFSLLAFTVALATGCPPVDAVDGDGGPSPEEDAGPQEPDAPTGSLGGGCYADGTCDDTLFCDGNVCVAPNVGDEGGACFPNGSCNAGLSCDLDDICVVVDNLGEERGPCYANDTCNAGLVCNPQSVCQQDLPAGVLGGPCREGGACDAGLYCLADRCEEAPPPVIVNFTVAPTLTVSGEPTVLSWEVTFAESCSLNGDDGYEAVDTVTLAPELTTTYTLRCSNAAGTAEAVRTVEVGTPVQILSFSINGTDAETTIDAGQTVTLIWASRFADTCTLDPADDEIATSGSLDVSPQHTTEYGLTCEGEDGPVTSTVIVRVNAAVSIVSFTANSATDAITADINDVVTLEWTATDAAACALEEADDDANVVRNTDVEATSSIAHTALASRTFTLTCEGVLGPVSSSIEMTVRPQVAILLLSTSTPSITTGDAAFVAYEIENADSCELTNTQSDALPPIEFDVGVVTVTPSQTTTYTLTCEGSGGPVALDLEIETLDPAVITSFTIAGNPATLVYRDTYTFDWAVTGNTNGCTVVGPGVLLNTGIGGVSVLASALGDPGALSEFTLTCRGDGGDDVSRINIPVAEVTLAANVRICVGNVRNCVATHTVEELEQVTRIDGTFLVRASISINFPRLATVNSATEIAVYDDAVISFPGLREIQNNATFEFTNSLDPEVLRDSGTLQAGELSDVEGDVFVSASFASSWDMDANRLAVVEALDIQNRPCASAFAFPGLVEVYGNVSVVHLSGLDAPDEHFPSLEYVDGNLSLAGHAYEIPDVNAWADNSGVQGTVSGISNASGACP